MFLPLLHDLMDMLFPRVCPGCGLPLNRKEKIICLFCLMKLPKTEFVCMTENPVEQLFKGRVNIHSANAFLYFTKSGLSQRLMHALKYNGNKELGVQMGKYFAAEIMKQTTFSAPDFITSVPLHPNKIKRRGYNQSEMIALGMSEKFCVPYRNDVLFRRQDLGTQTKRKRFERWENMRESFDIHDNESFKNKRIALVDDVITTGSTLEACSTLLKNQFSAEVSLFALCVAIH